MPIIVSFDGFWYKIFVTQAMPIMPIFQFRITSIIIGSAQIIFVGREFSYQIFEVIAH